MTEKEILKAEKEILKGRSISHCLRNSNLSSDQIEKILKDLVRQDPNIIKKIVTERTRYEKELYESRFNYSKPSSYLEGIDSDFLNSLEISAAFSSPNLLSKLSEDTQYNLKQNLKFAKLWATTGHSLSIFSDDIQTNFELFKSFSHNIKLISKLDLVGLYHKLYETNRTDLSIFISSLEILIDKSLTENKRLGMGLYEIIAECPELTQFALKQISNKSYEAALKKSKKNGKNFYEKFRSENRNYESLLPTLIKETETYKERENILSEIRKDGMKLGELKEDFNDKFWTDDKEIICAALRQNGLALQFVPSKYRNIHIIRLALEQNKEAVRFINPHYDIGTFDFRLKRLVNKARKTIRKEAKALKKLEEKNKVKTNKNIPTTQQRDSNSEEIETGITLDDLTKNGMVLKNIPLELQTSDIIAKAINNDVKAIKYADVSKIDSKIINIALSKLLEDFKTSEELKDVLSKIYLHQDGKIINFNERLHTYRKENIELLQKKLKELREKYNELSNINNTRNEEVKEKENKLKEVQQEIDSLENRVVKMSGNLEK